MKANISNETQEEILHRYEEQITLPPEKGARQFLLAPVGFVGSGKSTVLAMMAKRLPIVIVSTDALRKLLNERGFGYDAAGELTFQAVAHFAREGYSVAVDTHCGRLWKKERIEKIARETGANVFWMHVNPPEEYIIRKLTSYRHTWLFRNGAEAVENYRTHRASDEGVKVPFIYSIDPSKPNLERQVEEAATLIQDRL